MMADSTTLDKDDDRMMNLTIVSLFLWSQAA
jgi:hypothetical protein